MMHKTFRPAASWEGEQAGTDAFAWRQIPVLNTTIAQNFQDSPIIKYAVDGQLNVIHVQFALRRREVTS